MLRATIAAIALLMMTLALAPAANASYCVPKQVGHKCAGVWYENDGPERYPYYCYGLHHDGGYYTHCYGVYYSPGYDDLCVQWICLDGSVANFLIPMGCGIEVKDGICIPQNWGFK